MLDFIKRRLNSFKFAFEGLKAMKGETNFYIHLVIMVSVILLGIYQEITTNEWLLVTICIGMVLSAEIVNTSIEKLVDFISPEKQPQAKVIKDLSAAAVLIVAIVSAVVGVRIFVF